MLKIDLLKENPSNNVITVTAEDGTIHTYTVDITREISSDNTLQSLEVKIIHLLQILIKIH